MSKISYIKYHHTYKYELARQYKLQTSIVNHNVDIRYLELDPLGVLTIHQGYKWDGPSGPTFDTKNFMRGSLVHDALYQFFRMREVNVKKYRKYADQLLREICIQDGMSSIRAWWVYYAVRIGSKKSGKPGTQFKVADTMTAP